MLISQTYLTFALPERHGSFVGCLTEVMNAEEQSYAEYRHILWLPESTLLFHFLT